MNILAPIKKQQIDALYVTYAPMVLRRCRSLLHDEAEACDVMQEVFMRILTRDSLDLETPSSLLWNVATRLCLNRIRDKARHGVSDSSEALLERIACLEDTASDCENQNLLSKIFSREPESSRTIAVLHLIDGMTLEETAREVGLSVSGVRKRLRGLRSTLVELEAL